MWTAFALSLWLSSSPAPQSDPEVFYVEGIERYNAGDFEEAVELLSRAAALGATVPDYRYHLGLAYLKVDRPRDAAREMEAALGMMGMKRGTRVKEPVVLVQAAIAYLRQGQLETAKARASLALKRGEPSPDAQYVLGVVAGEEGDAKAAREHFESAVELDPDHVESNVALSSLYLEQGRLDEARERLRHASHGAPENFDVLMALGGLAYRVGDLAEAEEAFSQCVGIRPEDESASYNRGTVLLAQKRYAEAIEQLVAPAARSDEAAYNLAQAYVGAGRIAEARAALEALLERSPEYPGGRFALALLLESMDEVEGAERLYRECLSAGSSLAPAAVNLAVLLEREGRENEALDVLRATMGRLEDGDEAEVKGALALLEAKLAKR